MVKNKSKMIEKRYKLSSQEVESIKKIDEVYNNTFILLQGLQDSRNIILAEVRRRLDIKEQTVPDGYTRNVRLDNKTWEYITEDVLISEKKNNPKAN